MLLLGTSVSVVVVIPVWLVVWLLNLGRMEGFGGEVEVLSRGLFCGN